MAFCANCGSQVDGKYCAKCGAPVSAEATPGTNAPPPPVAPAMQAGGLSENVAAALCYLLTIVTGVLFLVLEPYNRNRTIRFHAFQAIFVGLAWFACMILVGIITVPLAFMGVYFVWSISRLLYLGFLVLLVVLMYKAYNNEKWVLPVIGPWAEKQA